MIRTVIRGVREYTGVVISRDLLSTGTCTVQAATTRSTYHAQNTLFSTRSLATSQSTMSESKPKISMAKRLEGTDKNVWVEFGKLAVEHEALNLGQGFPDFFPPDYVRDALSEAVKSPSPYMQQYTRSYGHPRLVKALSDLYSPMLGRTIDPNEEILISCGAYGSLFSAVQGLINPGDEVIIIEPYFDCYEPMVKVAGGIPVFVPLRPTKTEGAVSSGDWKLDPEELAGKFNAKTKAIFFNTPNNPLGKVYTMAETEMVADLCKKHDVVCFADEVYEWLVYSPFKHIKMASLPGMWDRTITIGSAGKTFSVTGWKLGWAVGPKHLIHALQTVHQNCVYTCSTLLQEAVAVGLEIERPRLEHPDCYFNQLPAELVPKKEKIAQLLSEVGMNPIVPEGGYFMIADFSKLKGVEFADTDEPKDYKFVKWMTKNKKLAAIPPSAFFSAEHKHLAENLVRFCFIKEDSTLDKAAEIINKWKEDA